jgi:hypothetical protein
MNWLRFCFVIELEFERVICVTPCCNAAVREECKGRAEWQVVEKKVVRLPGGAAIVWEVRDGVGGATRFGGRELEADVFPR